MKRKVKNLTLTIWRGTKNVWKKYHFLVPPKVMKKNLIYLRNILREGKGASARDLLYYNPLKKEDYNKWLEQNEKIDDYKKMSYEPLISFIIPVYNVEEKYLRECIDSILNQSYKNFEICIVDDASTKEETLGTLEKYKNNKKIHIKHRKKNGHISVTSNDALAMAKGEYVALMDDDDTLVPDALAEVVKALNKDKKIDMVYTDEDKLDLDGERCDPNFKPDYSPDTLLSNNYMSHLGVLRKTIVDEIGGFRKGYEGAQDYDLYLRFTEKAKKIYHIPKILYHWRMIPGSTSMEIDNKDYALERGREALNDALKRRGIKGEARIADGAPCYYIEYAVEVEPKIAVVIPTRDLAKITRKCLESVYKKTRYRNFEVIMMDNGSQEKETLKLFEEYKNKHENFRVIRADFEFNYAKLNNMAVKETDAEYILLLNNDIEVITPDWLKIMVGYASQPLIGAVGAKLIYPDNTIQHGGVIMGLGIASHAFMGLDRREMVWGGRLAVPYNYSAVTGACLMVSKKKWDEVRGLDEKLKVAYNDVDFCLKLLEKGYYNVLVPMVELYHHESKSRGADDTPEKKKRFDWEQDFMRDKWEKRIENDEFYNPNFTRQTWYMLDKGKKDGEKE